jgi:hypothetical protein
VTVPDFYECDPGTVVAPLPASGGGVAYEPVDSHTYLRAKLDAISVPGGSVPSARPEAGDGA